MADAAGCCWSPRHACGCGCRCRFRLPQHGAIVVEGPGGVKGMLSRRFWVRICKASGHVVGGGVWEFVHG